MSRETPRTADRRAAPRAIARTACAIAGVVSLMVVPAAADPIVVSSGTAMAMVNSLIGANSGITIVGTPTYTGASGAAGLFTGGSGILPFGSGVALTTGSAAGIPGPNSTPSYGVNNGTAGDANLTALAGAQTYDAASLQFSFIPTGNQISFQYVFGSEEYEELIDWFYNDVFAFYLNGGNIALVPATSTPVNASTVNYGSYSQYYTSNTDASLNIQYDGLAGATAGYPLLAIGNVIPNQVNTIQFVVADAGNPYYDTGVMFQDGSFSTNDTNVIANPEPGTLLLMGTGAVLLLRGVRKRSQQR